MLKVAAPVFVMIKAWDKLVPTGSFTKLKDVGLGWITGAGAGFTVSVAVALVTVPAVLLTTTAKLAPLSDVVVAGVV
jgi:hypothetical protein